MATTKSPEYQDTIIAGVDLSDSQYLAISPEGLLPTNAADVGGILQNKPKASEAASIVIAGASKYRATEGHTAGQRLQATTTGWLTAASSGYHIIGRALTACESGSVNLGVFQTISPPYAVNSKQAE
jgi:hypothetical protein